MFLSSLSTVVDEPCVVTVDPCTGGLLTDKWSLSYSSQHCTGDLPNSSSAISFQTLESGTLSPTTSTITDYDSVATTGNDYCFVMTGKTWTIAKTHFPDAVPKLVTRGTVFARMSPDQKQQLVQELQALGYYVGE